MKLSHLVAALLVALSAPVWAVNKCTGTDGKAVFQDTPCEGKGGRMDIRPASGDASPAASDKAAESLTNMKRNSAVLDAIAAGRPLVGMTAMELEQAMGAPSTVNADDYNGKRKNQLIYNRPTESYYVYTENGIVTAVQHRPAQAVASGARSGNCPTPHEIRNAETSASSTTISDTRRQALQQQVRDMKNCGRP